MVATDTARGAAAGIEIATASAQRIPVRIKLDPPPVGVELRYGLTASVMILADR